MSKILVLYFSVYGHVEKLAEAIAEGARGAGATVDVKRVPAINAGKDDKPEREQPAPVATVDELADYDAVIVGVGTRYGRMAAPMGAFWDQTGPLWAKGALVGKVGSAFTSTATQHGGQETTLMAIHTNLFHHGMVLVGLPYAWQGQMTLDEISGGAPYGITTIAGGKGERQPSENELEGARFQGKHVAEVTAKLFG